MASQEELQVAMDVLDLLTRAEGHIRNGASRASSVVDSIQSTLDSKYADEQPLSKDSSGTTLWVLDVSAYSDGDEVLVSDDGNSETVTVSSVHQDESATPLEDNNYLVVSEMSNSYTTGANAKVRRRDEESDYDKMVAGLVPIAGKNETSVTEGLSTIQTAIDWINENV